MAKIPGRDVRWSLSTDGGSTYSPFAGSISDGINFNFEGIPATDKDDLGWQIMLDAVGVRSAEGTSTLYITDTTIAALLLDNPSTYLHDLKLELSGLFDVEAQFFFTSFNPSGAEGAETAQAEVSFSSASAITYTAA